jgi:diguanylate cyclase (GGDEF)-like protein
LEAANRQLTILATTDRLTGLLNHGKFKQVLEEEFERSRRYKRSLSMVLLDVDRFKSFNDTFGHLVGDEVLTMVGKTIQANQRTTDLGARYGGEEFAVLLPETRANQAMVVGERLRAAVERLDVPYRQVTISVGVCTLTKQFGNSSEFLAAADRALYEAKNAGRNQVVQAKPALLARAA